MDSWERFDETSIPNKEAFNSELNLKDVLLMKTTYKLKIYLKS